MKLTSEKFYALASLQERFEQGDAQAGIEARAILTQDIRASVEQAKEHGELSADAINRCESALDAIQQNEAPMFLLDSVMAALA